MPKRILQGTVTSTANAQTVTVRVERRFKHPVLQKTVKKSKSYRAHDEAEVFKVGETVRIIECAPRSKTKRWEVMTEAMLADYQRSQDAASQAEREAYQARKAESESAQ